MKKQNGMNKLTFNKVAVMELNDSDLRAIEGGSLDTISQAVQQVLNDVHDAAYNVSYVITRAAMTR
jgi:hypothetical protein